MNRLAIVSLCLKLISRIYEQRVSKCSNGRCICWGSCRQFHCRNDCWYDFDDSIEFILHEAESISYRRKSSLYNKAESLRHSSTKRGRYFLNAKNNIFTNT